MDPNEALRHLRELLKSMNQNAENGDDIDPDDVGMAFELFEGLDEWLQKEGFLPDDWKRN